jgi:hypothetical protein
MIGWGLDPNSRTANRSAAPSIVHAHIHGIHTRCGAGRIPSGFGTAAFDGTAGGRPRVRQRIIVGITGVGTYSDELSGADIDHRLISRAGSNRRAIGRRRRRGVPAEAENDTARKADTVLPAVSASDGSWILEAKVVPVMVVGSIASLKVAETTVLTRTPVARLAGTVEITVGVPVVNVHT